MIWKMNVGWCSGATNHKMLKTKQNFCVQCLPLWTICVPSSGVSIVRKLGGHVHGVKNQGSQIHGIANQHELGDFERSLTAANRFFFKKMRVYLKAPGPWDRIWTATN